MLFDFVDEWISVWTSGFEKSLVHLTSGSESLAKPLGTGLRGLPPPTHLWTKSYVSTSYIYVSHSGHLLCVQWGVVHV